MLKNKNINKKTVLIAILSIGLIGAGSYWAYTQSQNNNQVDTPIAEGGINYDPPTEAEKKATEQHKENLSSQTPENQQSTNNSSIKSVEPIITSLGEYDNSIEASARVPNINESGGKCTLTLRKNSKQVSANRTGTSNVSEVSCGYISIPKSKLSSGVWSATVSYSSTKAKGTSTPQNIKIN